MRAISFSVAAHVKVKARRVRDTEAISTELHHENKTKGSAHSPPHPPPSLKRALPRHREHAEEKGRETRMSDERHLIQSKNNDANMKTSERGDSDGHRRTHTHTHTHVSISVNIYIYTYT